MTDRFPIEVLPTPLRQFIEETAKALPVPVDMVAAPALAAASAAIGASRYIRIKESWKEPAALYVAIVAPTGSLKTPSLRVATSPILEQQRLFERASAEKSKTDANGKELPSISSSRRTWTEDATVEALGHLLAENPYGLLLIRDELSGWVRSMDQYRSGKGADRQFYLSTWSGGSTSTDRMGRASITVANPFLSVVGTIPSDILSDLADEQGREDGFLPRMLFAFPDQDPVRWTDADISQRARDQYGALFVELYDLLGEKNSATGELIGPVYLSLTPDGLHRFIAWHDIHCQEMESDNTSPLLKGFLSKLKGYCLRLALIHAVCTNPATIDIPLKSIEAAISMTAYFKAHATKVCALLARPPKTRVERCKEEILRNLSNGRIRTKRELQQPTNFDAKVFNPALQELLREGKVIETTKQGTRRPVKAFRLLPG